MTDKAGDASGKLRLVHTSPLYTWAGIGADSEFVELAMIAGDTAREREENFAKLIEAAKRA